MTAVVSWELRWPPRSREIQDGRRGHARSKMAAEVTRDPRWPPRSREIQDGRRGYARSKMAAEVTRDPRWPPRLREIQDGRRGHNYHRVVCWASHTTDYIRILMTCDFRFSLFVTNISLINHYQYRNRIDIFPPVVTKIYSTHEINTLHM